VNTGSGNSAHDNLIIQADQAAAQWLVIPERFMQQYVQMGLLPSYKLGKHRLFRKNELLKALGATRRATRAEILR
jgi:excisionase family DNA binding protein